MMRQQLEEMAMHILEHGEIKPNYTKRDFINCVLIFQSAIIDKMFDLQNQEDMTKQDRANMAESCGNAIHKLIMTYTGLDTRKVEEFL